MIEHKFTIRCPYDSFSDYIELRYAYRLDGRIVMATDVTMMEAEPGTMMPVMARLEREVGQQMLDELWTLGFRPSGERKQQQDNLLWYQEQLAKFIARSTR